LTIFIKRPYRQASLMAKSSPQQSTRFKLRNQGLNLGQTTSPVLHPHFAHSYSAPLNEEREQGGLLGRIRTTGRGKQSNSCVPNRSIKEVLGYPLTKRFRELLGGVA